MAEELTPIVFRKSPETIVSYSFTDILRGTAYLKLYCSAAFPKATIYESLTQTDDADGSLNSGEQKCQTFTIGTTGTNTNFWINGIEYYGRGSHAINVYIKAVDGGTGKPTGNILSSGSENPNDLSSAVNAWHRINLNSPVLLLASTKYALILQTPGSGDIWRYDGSSPTYAGGSYGESADSGATWTMDTNKDFLFKILGDVRPFLTFFEENMQIADALLLENIVTNQNYVEQIEFNIDVVIGKNSKIQGTAFINNPIAVNQGSNNMVSFYYTNNILKVVNGVETSIGTADTKADSSATITTNLNLLSQVYIENPVSFQIGDVLRLKSKLYIKTNLGQDDADVTIDFKNIWINIPFKLDL